MIALLVSGCQKIPSDNTTGSKSSFPVADRSTLLATISDGEISSDNDLRITFASLGRGVAYTAKKGDRIYVVHNGRPGRLHEGIGSLSLSPDGSRHAYTAMDGVKWRMVVDGQPGEPFDMVESPQFSPDGKHLLFQVLKDGLWNLVVDGKSSIGSVKRYREYQFTADSELIVYIDKVDDNRKGSLVVSDIAFKNARTIDAGVTSLFLNVDQTTVAAVIKDDTGNERVIQFSVAKLDNVTRGAVYEKVRNIAFAPGSDIAYFGERQGRMYGVYNGQEELLPVGLKPGPTVINQSRKTVGVLMSANNTSYLYEIFQNSGKKGKAYDEAEWLTYSSDGACSALTARQGKRWFVVVNGKEGPEFDRVVSPKFSPDGKSLVYRARQDGKRFVVVADAAGNVLRKHPEYEQVFDLQFTADGKSVAYGVKDGKFLAWKVEPL